MALTQPNNGVTETLTRGQKLEACLRKIQRAERVSPFREHAQELLQSAADPKATASALARTILKDLGLTTDTIRAANSPLRMRSGRRIDDIAHAVSFLGLEAIQKLVAAARYIEHYSVRSPVVRELLVMSVLNARHARELSIQGGHTRTEDNYVLGLMRRIGEVLMATHFPVEYAQSLVVMQQEDVPREMAYLRMLGCTPDEIGERIATTWNLPPNLKPCFTKQDPGAAPPFIRSLISIVNFSDDLTEQVYQRGFAMDRLDLRPVYDARGGRVNLSGSVLSAIVERAAQETEAMCIALDVPIENLRLERQIENCRSVLASSPMFGAERLSDLDAAIDAAQKALKQPEFDLGQLIAELLEAIRGVGFDRVVFALVNDGRTLLGGKIASAPDEADVLNRFQFWMHQSDGPIRAAFSGKIDILVNCEFDLRYNESKLMERLAPKAFALFPIMVDRKVIGCLYADRQLYTAGLERVQGPMSRVREVISVGLQLKASQTAGMHAMMNEHDRGTGSASSRDRRPAQRREIDAI